MKLVVLESFVTTDLYSLYEGVPPQGGICHALQARGGYQHFMAKEIILQLVCFAKVINSKLGIAE